MSVIARKKLVLAMIMSGLRKKTAREKRIDPIAAAIILQSFLDFNSTGCRSMSILPVTYNDPILREKTKELVERTRVSSSL